MPVLQQGPRCFTLNVLSLHWAFKKWHELLYVFPSDPHIGLWGAFLHLVVHFLQNPWPAIFNVLSGRERWDSQCWIQSLNSRGRQIFKSFFFLIEIFVTFYRIFKILEILEILEIFLKHFKIFDIFWRFSRFLRLRFMRFFSRSGIFCPFWIERVDQFLGDHIILWERDTRID